MSVSKRVSQDGLVRVGQQWQDLKQFDAGYGILARKRTMEVLDIRQAIREPQNEYALVVITEPGYHPASGQWHDAGKRGMIRIDRFADGKTFKLVKDAGIVQPGKSYVKKSGSPYVMPLLVKVLSVGANFAYCEVQIPGSVPYQTCRISLNRFFPGPDHLYDLYQPPKREVASSPALGAPYKMSTLGLIDYVRTIIESINEVSPTPSIAGQQDNAKPADWSMNDTARAAEHVVNPGEHDLIAKIAPDYVAFFKWLDKAKPYWRSWSPNMTILSDLLAAYDAGRASK